jgi:integrase
VNPYTGVGEKFVVKFSIFEDPGRRSPYGVRYWLSEHKPVRTFYRTREEAAQRQAKLEACFAVGGIQAVQRIDENVELAEARQLAEAAGKNILDLVRHSLSVSKNRSGGITLRHAFDGFMRRAAEIQLRTSTVEFYTQELERFMGSFGDKRRTGEITREMIRSYIDIRSTRSQPHALRAIRAWLRWMLRQDPPLISADPSVGMAVEQSREERKLAFLTNAETSRLLEHCGADIRPAVALMLFTGIRAEEIYRENATGGEDVLHWEDVDFIHKAIYLRSEVSKTRVSRTLRKLPRNLWAWLPEGKKRKGPICAVRLRERLEAARKAACLTKWAKSILRHTCASHHVAAYGNLSATAILIRHESDVALLNRRYREGVQITKADGTRFFRLEPKAASTAPPSGLGVG